MKNKHFGLPVDHPVMGSIPVIGDKLQAKANHIIHADQNLTQPTTVHVNTHILHTG